MTGKSISACLWIAATAIASLPACAVTPHAKHAPKAQAFAKPPVSAKSIVFVHGMFMTPASWQPWRTYFEDHGYTTYAPAWPRHDGSAAELRERHPDTALGALTLSEVVASYRQFIDALPEKPIVIGHSMGGLITQLLLQEQRAAAGIVVDSAPPKGVISLKWSFLRSNWPVIAPFAEEKEAVLLTPEQFAYAFSNCIPEGQQAAIYTDHAAPESRLVGKGLRTDAAEIDYAKKSAPLLFLAGGEDHIIPASLNFDNFEEYSSAPSLTEFKLFPERCHWTVAQDGWEEVAGYVLSWLQAA